MKQSFIFRPMRHALSSPPTGSRGFDPNPAFNIVIAYEDFDAGKNAKRTCDFLVTQLGTECSCTNQMWKFGVLNIPKLHEIAAQDARLADIIMISCSSDEFPKVVKDWIENWLPDAHNTLAIVGLFDPSQPAEKFWATRTYLAEAARRGGLEFFAQPDDWPGHHLPHGFFLTGTEQSDRSLTNLVRAVQPDLSFRRWGINE